MLAATSSAVLTMVASFLSLILLSSSVSKFVDFATFRTTLQGYGVRSSLLAQIIVAAEFGLGFGLVTGIAFPLFALGGAVLIVIFSVAILRLLSAGSVTPCGCGGLLGSQPVSRSSLRRNGILVIMAATAAIGSNWVSTPSILALFTEPISVSGIAWATVATSVGTLAVVVGVYEAASSRRIRKPVDKEVSRAANTEAPEPVFLALYETDIPAR